MKNIIVLIFLLFLTSSAFSQSYKLSGQLMDSKTKMPLSFGTIKLIEKNITTTADKEGEFIIHLKPGFYKLSASYIGYFSDTIDIAINDNDETRNIYLQPSEILTEEIQVVGEDPAYEIIRKAIKYKKTFQENLVEYNYNAFTKYVIRTNVNGSMQDNTYVDSTTGKTEFGIFGLLESETKGYFKKPDLEKQIVISKKESANISRGFAIPFIVNFYDEKIDFGEVKIPTPLSDDAFDEYEFKLKSITSIDSMKVYKIKVINQSENVPQFYGDIYILDSTFSLIKVNLNTNDASKMNGIDELNFKQKFSEFNDSSMKNYWLPTDVEIFAEGSLLGLFQFKGEVFTVVSNYNINEKAPDGIFDDVIIKIMPDAEKDSLYWLAHQVIMNSNEELKAYITIKKTTEERSESVRISPFGLRFGKYISSNVLDYYSFNRVEGSSLGFNLIFTKDFGKYNAFGYYGYGFLDKKPKYELTTDLNLLNDKSLNISAGIFNRLRPLFSNPGILDMDFNTISSLLYKDDRYDYFYSSGWNFSISKRIIPQFSLGIDYFQAKQTSAKKNTDYSFFKKDDHYPENLNINDAFNRTLSVSINIDPNIYKAIDWGDGEITRFPITEFPTLDFSLSNTSKNLGSTFDFRRFEFKLRGENYINWFIKLKYFLGGIFMNGDVPYQSLAYFKTRIDMTDLPIYLPMVYKEFLGDRLYYLNIENDFGKLLWGNIPILKNFNFVGIFNVGRTEISNSNRNLYSSTNFATTKGYYAEAGFAIANILNILRIESVWRLNNLNTGNNFVIDILMEK